MRIALRVLFLIVVVVLLPVRFVRAQGQSGVNAESAAKPAGENEIKKRKDFAETVRQTTVTKMGTSISPGFNITAEGPDATFYVQHAAGVTSPICKAMLVDAFISKMREFGFTKIVCTDDKDKTFTYYSEHQIGDIFQLAA